MGTINTLLTVVLVAVVAYILFHPRNNAVGVIGALGSGSLGFTRTLTGQYSGGQYEPGGY